MAESVQVRNSPNTTPVFIEPGTLFSPKFDVTKYGYTKFLLSECRLLTAIEYGQYRKYVESKNEYFGDIFNSMGLLTLKNVIEYPINFDDENVFSLVVKTDDTSRALAETFIQFLIYLISDNHAKGEVVFRCADNEKGGQSFGKFITLISH